MGMFAFLAHPGDYGHMDGGAGMWLWGTLMILFWVLLVGAVVWLLIRTLGGAAGAGRADSTRRAKEVLAERYARGEMSTEEYRERIETLG